MRLKTLERLCNSIKQNPYNEAHKVFRLRKAGIVVVVTRRNPAYYCLEKNWKLKIQKLAIK